MLKEINKNIKKVMTMLMKQDIIKKDEKRIKIYVFKAISRKNSIIFQVESYYLVKDNRCKNIEELASIVKKLTDTIYDTVGLLSKIEINLHPPCDIIPIYSVPPWICEKLSNEERTEFWDSYKNIYTEEDKK